MFSPMESPDDCPIPIKYIDVWRYTDTDLAHKHEKSLHDVWVAYESDKAQLSGRWVGTTKFDILERPPSKGHVGQS